MRSDAKHNREKTKNKTHPTKKKKKNAAETRHYNGRAPDLQGALLGELTNGETMVDRGRLTEAGFKYTNISVPAAVV